MQLAHPFVQLPLSFDAPRLAAEIAALGESVWKPHPEGFPGNTMLPLVAADGDAEDERFAGEMRPTPHLERCPYLWQVFASLGATIGRSRLMRLDNRSEVTRHADQHYYWSERVRIHVPIVTQPSVRFECGDANVNMAAGECWIFDTWRQHRVTNDNDQKRIHLVADSVGGAEFWAHVAAGRPQPEREPKPGWTPRFVPYDPSISRPPIMLERRNLPTVMTPWEIESHLAFLLGESREHVLLHAVHQRASLFTRKWRGLWAAYGEDPEGHPHFRRCLDEFLAGVRGEATPVMLVNDIPLYNCIVSMIGKAALADKATAASASEYAFALN